MEFCAKLCSFAIVVVVVYVFPCISMSSCCVCDKFVYCCCGAFPVGSFVVSTELTDVMLDERTVDKTAYGLFVGEVVGGDKCLFSLLLGPSPPGAVLFPLPLAIKIWQ